MKRYMIALSDDTRTKFIGEIDFELYMQFGEHSRIFKLQFPPRAVTSRNNKKPNTALCYTLNPWNAGLYLFKS